LSQRWALVLARRVDHPDGSFAGVLFVRWDIDRLTTLLESIHIGQKGTIELRTSDMVQVSRYPSIDHPELGPGNKRVPAHLSRMLQISPRVALIGQSLPWIKLKGTTPTLRLANILF